MDQIQLSNMNRDTLQAQNIFTKSTVNPNINFIPNQPEIKFSFRQQMQPHITHQSRPNFLPSHHQPYQRYSHDIPLNNQPNPNNAFVHLRNQISNLRSQFSKLIQKDNTKITEKVSYQSRDKDKKDTSPNKLINRMPTYSTIGFYNKATQTERKQPFQAKLKIDQNFSFKNKNSQEQKSVIVDKTSPDMKKQFTSIDNGKVLAKSFLDKKQTMVLPSQTNIIQNLQKELVRQTELRIKAEQGLQKCSKEFSIKQQNFQKRLSEKAEQTQKLKLMIDQVNISLSLKNSLVQKFQLEISKIKKQNQYLFCQLKGQVETAKKIQEKYQSQLTITEEKYQKRIAQVMNKCRITESQLLRHKQQKSQVCLKLEELVKKYQGLSSENKKLQLQINELNEQINKSVQREKQILQAKRKLESQQLHKYQPQSTRESTLSPQVSVKLKNLEQENADLKKRVESFKKSIQQLNISNNSSRQKYAQAKEQLKVLREQSLLKQALINSLYRDIAILDNQMRQIPMYKSVIATNTKLIEDLNSKIIHLQLQKISHKYIQIEM